MTATDNPGPIGRNPRQVAGPTVDPQQEDDAGESRVVDLREQSASDPDPDVEPEPTADADPEVEREPELVSDADPEVEREPATQPDPEPEPESTSDTDREVEPELEPASGADPDVEPELEPASGRDPEVEPAPAMDADPEVELELGFMGETSELRRRWELVQASFVDDPRRAVEEADEMVSVAVAALQAHIEQRREDLAETWRGTEQGSTDELLVAFQRYRAMFDGVLST